VEPIVSLNFQGASNGLTSATVTLNSTHFGMCAWVNLQLGAPAGGVFYLKDNNLTGKTTGMNLDGTVGSKNFEIITPSGSTKAMFTATLNTWYFVAMTINGTTYTAYWSQAGGGGTLSSTSSTDATSIASYSNYWVGSDSGNDTFFGKVAAMTFWSGVTPTTAQLQSQMASQKPLSTASLFAQYPLFNTTDGNIDYSGNGHTLTVPTTAPVTDTGPPASWM
jgi:hypothetical protein